MTAAVPDGFRLTVACVTGSLYNVPADKAERTMSLVADDATHVVALIRDEDGGRAATFHVVTENPDPDCQGDWTLASDDGLALDLPMDGMRQDVGRTADVTGQQLSVIARLLNHGAPTRVEGFDSPWDYVALSFWDGPGWYRTPLADGGDMVGGLPVCTWHDTPQFLVWEYRYDQSALRDTALVGDGPVPVAEDGRWLWPSPYYVSGDVWAACCLRRLALEVGRNEDAEEVERAVFDAVPCHRRERVGLSRGLVRGVLSAAEGLEEFRRALSLNAEAAQGGVMSMATAPARDGGEPRHAR